MIISGRNASPLVNLLKFSSFSCCVLYLSVLAFDLVYFVNFCFDEGLWVASLYEFSLRVLSSVCKYVVVDCNSSLSKCL